MNRHETSRFFRLEVVLVAPVPPKKAIQTDGRFAATADRRRYGVSRLGKNETRDSDGRNIRRGSGAEYS